MKSNTVVSISESATEKYTGSKDRFEVGDKLIFEYSAMRFPSDPPNTIILCGLKNKIRGDDLVGAVRSNGSDPKNDAITLPDRRGVGVNSKNFAGNYLRFSEDVFICEGPEGDLLLNRYY